MEIYLNVKFWFYIFDGVKKFREHSALIKFLFSLF